MPPTAATLGAYSARCITPPGRTFGRTLPGGAVSWISREAAFAMQTAFVSGILQYWPEAPHRPSVTVITVPPTDRQSQAESAIACEPAVNSSSAGTQTNNKTLNADDIADLHKQISRDGELTNSNITLAHLHSCAIKEESPGLQTRERGKPLVLQKKSRGLVIGRCFGRFCRSALTHSDERRIASSREQELRRACSTNRDHALLGFAIFLFLVELLSGGHPNGTHQVFAYCGIFLRSPDSCERGAKAVWS